MPVQAGAPDGCTTIIHATYMERMKAVLETSYKSKLPQGWSYPIGAQVLSDLLGEIDGAAECPLSFWDYQIRASHHRQVREHGKPYSIVEVSYSRPYSEHRVEDLQWSVTVNPVPSDKAAAVRRCVVSSGLPEIRKWLIQSRVVDAKQGRGFCHLLYDELDGRLLVQSRLNNIDDPTEIELPCVGESSETG